VLVPVATLQAPFWRIPTLPKDRTLDPAHPRRYTRNAATAYGIFVCLAR
jgi:hypothetical protein